MATVQGAWLWYELMTSDAAGAKAFYEAVIGWSITPGTEPPIYYGHIARADGGAQGGMIEITPDMAAKGARPAWVGYIGVDDIAATLITITAAGGQVLMPTMTIDEGSFAMVTDPGGAPFYIMTPTPKPGSDASTAFSPRQVGSCGWNELHAADFARERDFYTGQFGWNLPGAMDMGSFGTYQFLGHGEVPIGAMMQKAPHIPVAGWTFYFRVPSIAAAVEAVKAAGGRVAHGPVEVPGGDHIINGFDPQGAAFSLVGGA